jgi:hypothetical protein
MPRIIPSAAFALLATTMTAPAQSIGMGAIGGSLTGINSFSGDIMNGPQGAVSTGIGVSVTMGGASRITAKDDPYAARDGCINYPGQAHNSADCSRIISWDPSWVVPSKPLSEMTGAEENMVRSYNILNGKQSR